jgi:hypothetical protein
MRLPVTTLMFLFALFWGGLPTQEKLCVNIAFPSSIHVT